MSLKQEIADIKAAINSPATPDAQKEVMRGILAKLEAKLPSESEKKPVKRTEKRPKPSASKDKTGFGWTLELSSVGNPDRGQDPDKPMYGAEPNKEVSVKSFSEASKIALKFIDDNDLGGGNWSGGQLYDDHNNPFAYVAYNGKIFEGEVGGSTYKLLYDPFEGKRTPIDAPKKLSVAEMKKAIDTKTVSKYSPEEQKQIMEFAFGKEFMASEDKGRLKEYDEDKDKDEYDCDDLIEKAKKAAAKRKKAAEKREAKTEKTQNKERTERSIELVEKSIETRIEKGQKVSADEIKAVIKMHEEAIKHLKELLSKIA